MTVKVPVKQRDEVGKNPASSEVECYNYENCNKKGKRKKTDRGFVIRLSSSQRA